MPTIDATLVDYISRFPSEARSEALAFITLFLGAAAGWQLKDLTPSARDLEAALIAFQASPACQALQLTEAERGSLNCYIPILAEREQEKEHILKCRSRIDAERPILVKTLADAFGLTPQHRKKLAEIPVILASEKFFDYRHSGSFPLPSLEQRDAMQSLMDLRHIMVMYKNMEEIGRHICKIFPLAAYSLKTHSVQLGFEGEEDLLHDPEFARYFLAAELGHALLDITVGPRCRPSLSVHEFYETAATNVYVKESRYGEKKAQELQELLTSCRRTVEDILEEHPELSQIQPVPREDPELAGAIKNIKDFIADLKAIPGGGQTSLEDQHGPSLVPYHRTYVLFFQYWLDHKRAPIEKTIRRFKRNYPLSAGVEREILEDYSRDGEPSHCGGAFLYHSLFEAIKTKVPAEERVATLARIAGQALYTNSIDFRDTLMFLASVKKRLL